jgi:hypothetical protein
VFKLRAFVKSCKKLSITDAMLLKAADEIYRGIHDGELGSHLFKKRLARLNAGKRSGFRVLYVHHVANHIFFVFGYQKNDMENVSKEELDDFKALSSKLSNLNDEQLNQLIVANSFIEVQADEKI